MTFNFSDLGKQIINPIVGLYLGKSVIPVNSKGEVSGLNYEEEKITVNWSVDDKDVHTYFTFTQFTQLKEAGVLKDLQGFVAPPEPKFEVGDIVEGCAVAGIIKYRKYNAVKGIWLYTVLSIDGILSDNYDTRYDMQEEEDLTLLEEIDEEVDFKSNLTYKIKIEKVNKN